MEIAAIIISVIALLLSTASFYFQFFYKRDAVTCTPVGFDVKTERVTVQLAIANAGTRPIMLRDARLRLQFKAKICGTMSLEDMQHQNILEPILIPKDEIRSVTLTLPINDDMRNCVTSWHDSGNLIDSDGSWPIRARVVFITVSGKIIDSEEVVITVTWNKDGSSSSRRNEAWQIGYWQFEKLFAKISKDISFL